MKPRTPPLGILLGTSLLLPGAAQAAEQSVLIAGVPHVAQKPDFCGEACVEMVLKQSGSDLDQDDVFAAAGLDPALGRGLYTAELKRAVERLGFAPGPVWADVSATQPLEETRRHWAELYRDLQAGVPSIVCMRYDERPDTTEHFRLILGYDAAKGEVLYHEPAMEGGAYQRMALSRFLSLWPLRDTARNSFLVRLRMARSGTDSYQRSALRFSPADYAQHVQALRARLPGPGFSVILEPPFVVIGDESPAEVRAHATGTVRWAVQKLKRDYFSEDPQDILDIWLFRDANSYRKNARALFGEEPSTPYGYYLRRDRALVMNIATGGGTLVHELVHPFIAANFPRCPPWLNEGLGSLYEQSDEVDGHISGLPNWRLPGLQAAIRARAVPRFQTLMAMDDDAFYDDDSGVHYAAARYLLYYLQEQGLLVRYYRAFHAAQAADPTGYTTLVKILGEEDMGAFEGRWRRFVLELHR